MVRDYTDPIPEFSEEINIRTVSTARQETTVGEGFALGCVAVGRQSFNGQKMSIEFAFEHAWRNWPYNSRFRRCALTSSATA